MDPFVLGFYAVICGVLGWVAPNLGPPFVRFGIGAVIGIVAAGLLPTLRSFFGS